MLRGVPAHTELVTNGNEWIVAYDPATGRELWRTAGVKSNAIHTPLVGEGLVIVTAGFPERRVIAIRPGGASGLPESDRELLALKFIAHHTNREIAVVLEISEAAVAMRLLRALRKLRKQLQDKGWG